MLRNVAAHGWLSCKPISLRKYVHSFVFCTKMFVILTTKFTEQILGTYQRAHAGTGIGS